MGGLPREAAELSRVAKTVEKVQSAMVEIQRWPSGLERLRPGGHRGRRRRSQQVIGYGSSPWRPGKPP